MDRSVIVVGRHNHGTGYSELLHLRRDSRVSVSLLKPYHSISTVLLSCLDGQVVLIVIKHNPPKEYTWCRQVNTELSQVSHTMGAANFSIQLALYRYHESGESMKIMCRILHVDILDRVLGVRLRGSGFISLVGCREDTTFETLRGGVGYPFV